MKFQAIISICILTLLSVGCTKEDASTAGGKGKPIITGHITDVNGTPLEHIKVTLDIQGSYNDAVYSSSEGIYIAFFMPEWDKNGKCEIKVSIEDIDGKQNGGEFASIHDTILLLKDNLSDERIRIQKDYLLKYAIE